MILVDTILDLRRARNLSLGMKENTALEEPIRFPLTSSILRFSLDFETAKQKKCLHAFDLQQRLAFVRRMPSSMFNGGRSAAGLLILCGLLVTLWNLQRAVGPLGEAFHQLSVQQEAPLSGSSEAQQPDDAQRSISQIQNTMSRVASSAHRGFFWSFCFISCAVLIGAACLWGQSHASTTVIRFSVLAESRYREDLPEQLSIADAATTFREAANALGGLTRSFNDVVIALNALRAFSDTMDETRDMLRKSLEAIPVRIQESMGLVTKDMVRNLETAMKEQADAIHRILVIYGEQEFRIGEIRQQVAAIHTLSERIAQSAAPLETVPTHLAAINNALRQHSSATYRLEATAKLIETAIHEIPSEQLLESAHALSDSASQLRISHSEVLQESKTLLERSAGLENTARELRERFESLEQISKDTLRKLEQATIESSGDRKRLGDQVTGMVSNAVDEIAKVVGDHGHDLLFAKVSDFDAKLENFLSRLRITRPQVDSGTSDAAFYQSSAAVFKAAAEERPISSAAMREEAIHMVHEPPDVVSASANTSTENGLPKTPDAEPRG